MIGTNFGIYRPSASAAPTGNAASGSSTSSNTQPAPTTAAVRAEPLSAVPSSSVSNVQVTSRNIAAANINRNPQIAFTGANTPSAHFVTNVSFGQHSGNAPSANTANKVDTEDHQPLNLGDFMAHLKDYTPTIPDDVILQYISRGGFETDDERIVRLISLIVQKFATDICNDTLQHCKVRINAVHPGGNAAKAAKVTKEKKFTFTNEDLAAALADYGINVRKPIYFP